MDSSFDEYYTKALKFLRFRPRSEKEVRDNLIKKNASEDIINGIVELLIKQKFLGDRDFVRWRIRQRTEFKPRSSYFIKRELLQKGVSKEIIDEIFSDPTTEKKDDVTMAKELAEKRVEKLKHLKKKEIYQKLGMYLGRRGFSWDVIKCAIDASLK